MAAINSPKRDTHAGRINRRCVVDGYAMLSLSHRLLISRWLGHCRASLMALKALVMPGFESMAPATLPLGTSGRTFTGQPGNAWQAVPPLTRRV